MNSPKNPPIDPDALYDLRVHEGVNMQCMFNLDRIYGSDLIRDYLEDFIPKVWDNAYIIWREV